MQQQSQRVETPNLKADRQDKPAPWRVVGLAALTVVLAVVQCGCSRSMPKGEPAAALFFEPIGPVRLLRHAPRATPSQPDSEPAPDPTAARPDMLERRGQPKVPDSKLRLDIGMKLEASDFVTGHVDYVVDQQTVVLTGRVATPTARDRLELLARSVDGVRAVVNRLHVDQQIPQPDE